MALSATLSETGNLMVLERRETERKLQLLKSLLNISLQFQALVQGLHNLFCQTTAVGNSSTNATGSRLEILSKCFYFYLPHTPPPPPRHGGSALTLMACVKKINCALAAELNCCAVKCDNDFQAVSP